MADEPNPQDTPQTPDVADTPTEPTPPTKTFTQDEVNALITKRLGREKQSWQAELEAERQRATMTAEEKLKADLEAEKQRSQQTMSAARQGLIEARAESAAVTLGVKPERVEKFLKLVDFSEVGDGEDGRPDRAAITAALETVLTEFPEFKGAATVSVGGGSNPPGAAHAGKTDVATLTQAQLDDMVKRALSGERITL